MSSGRHPLERLPAPSVRPQTAAWVRELAENVGAKPSGVIARLLEKLYNFPVLYAQVQAYPYGNVLNTAAHPRTNTPAHTGVQSERVSAESGRFAAPADTGAHLSTLAPLHTSVHETRHPTSSSSSTLSTQEEEGARARVHLGSGRSAWPVLAQSLLESYPHGWDDAGLKRIPTPIDVEIALRPWIRERVDPSEILAGAERFRNAKPGPSRQYVPGLLKWLRSKGWEAKLERASADESGEYDAVEGHRRNIEKTKKQQEAARRGNLDMPLTKPTAYRTQPPQGGPA